MRAFSLALALATFVFASAAGAQATLTISREVRNSPRNAEISGGVPLTAPIGVRDCSCETWQFTVDYSNLPQPSVLSWWVSTSMTGCDTAAGRSTLNPATQTCFQLTDPSVTPAAFMPGATGTVLVSVPSRFLVNPVDGSCTPLSSQTTASTLYFTALVLSTGDAPAASSYKPVSYNITTPPAPYNVSAAAEEGGAIVSWSTVSTTTSDSGTTTVDDSGAITSTFSPSVVGFYVLCLPRSPTWDAGTDANTCYSPVDVTARDATDVTDVTDVSTVTDVTDVTDATDVADVTGGSEAGVDAGVFDASSDVAVADAGDGGEGGSGNVACTQSLPSNFDPNDPNQFNQYVCSSLQGLTATTFEVTGLTNGSVYRFAVVSEDNAGNRSVAAMTPDCTTPELVTDFWEHYRDRGGQAQPGFCSVRPGPAARAGSVAWALGAAAVVLAARRRRRSDAAAKTGRCGS